MRRIGKRRLVLRSALNGMVGVLLCSENLTYTLRQNHHITDPFILASNFEDLFREKYINHI